MENHAYLMIGQHLFLKGPLLAVNASTVTFPESYVVSLSEGQSLPTTTTTTTEGPLVTADQGTLEAHGLLRLSKSTLELSVSGPLADLTNKSTFTATDALIDAMTSQGASPHHLEAKLAGGAGSGEIRLERGGG